MMPTPQTSHSSQANRRISRRKGVRRPCTLVLPGQPPRELTTWDLGLDGMCLLSPRPVTPGARCEARFELPGLAAPLQAQGKVVYSSFCGIDGFRIGLVFSDLEDAVADAIQHFVDA